MNNEFNNGWDYYPFTISEYWLSALINGDYSGLDGDEIEAFSDWEYSSLELVRGAISFHWDCDNDSYFGKDDITGLMADVVKVRLVFKKEL